MGCKYCARRERSKYTTQERLIDSQELSAYVGYSALQVEIAYDNSGKPVLVANYEDGRGYENSIDDAVFIKYCPMCGEKL